MTDVAWVALGSNIPSRTQALARLRDALQCDGVRIEAASPVVLTRAVGFTRQDDFHNQVVKLRSSEPREPEHWLRQCKAAELRAGRRESFRWGPRRADADILLLGELGEVEVHTELLTVPHLALQDRPFLVRLLRQAGYTGVAGS